MSITILKAKPWEKKWECKDANKNQNNSSRNRKFHRSKVDTIQKSNNLFFKFSIFWVCDIIVHVQRIVRFCIFSRNSMPRNRENSWIVLFSALFGFFRDVFSSLKNLFGARTNPSQYNFLEQIIQKWPKNFAKNPTGVRAGRAIFTTIFSFFSYDKNAQK